MKKKKVIICLCIFVVIGIIVLINKDKEVLKSDEVANNTFAYMLLVYKPF